MNKVEKDLSKEFNKVLKETAEQRTKDPDSKMGVNLISHILSLSDEEIKKESKFLKEAIENSLDKGSIVEKLIEMNMVGQTIEDLKEENKELKTFSTEIRELGFSKEKENLFKSIFEKIIEFNERVVQYGIRPRVNVYIEKLNDAAVIPKYSNSNDAGFDIYTIQDETLPPESVKLVKTGLALAIPDGYEIQIRPRSGWSSKEVNLNMFLANSPGTINK